MPSPKIELGRTPLLEASSPAASPAPVAGTTSKTNNAALAALSGAACVAAVAVLSTVTLGAGLFLALVLVAALSGITSYLSGRHAYELGNAQPVAEAAPEAEAPRGDIFEEFKRVFTQFLGGFTLPADMNERYVTHVNEPGQVKIGENTFDVTEQFAKDYNRYHRIIMAQPSRASVYGGEDKTAQFPSLYRDLVALSDDKQLHNILFELLSQTSSNAVTQPLMNSLYGQHPDLLNTVLFTPSMPTIILEQESDSQFRLTYEVDAQLKDMTNASNISKVAYTFDIVVKKDSSGQWTTETTTPRELTLDPTQRKSAQYLKS